MPTYVYRCENGHQFEVFQSITADAISTCEVCDAAATRLLFAPAIHFKGKGFHNTDYGTKRRPVGGDSDSSGGGDKATSTTSSDGSSSTGSGSSSSDSSSSSSSSSSGSKTIGLDKA